MLEGITRGQGRIVFNTEMRAPKPSCSVEETLGYSTSRTRHLPDSLWVRKGWGRSYYSDHPDNTRHCRLSGPTLGPSTIFAAFHIDSLVLHSHGPLPRNPATPLARQQPRLRYWRWSPSAWSTNHRRMNRSESFWAFLGKELWANLACTRSRLVRASK